MNDSNDKEIFPIAIFLDTNILDSLPENLTAGDLSGLVADADNIGAKVYISDVVAREWLKHRIDKFLDSYKNYIKCRNHIKKYFTDIPEFNITKDEFWNNVHGSFVSYLKKCGCRLLAPPNATIRTLTERAVAAVPPFRYGNKGFKDELVILSMLKLVERGWNYKTYVIVTQDNDFPSQELKKRFAQHEVKFERVNSLQDARKLLDEKLNATWKQERAAREAEVTGFLSKHWDSISQAVVREVEEKGVSLYNLFSFGRDDIPKDSNIKMIVKTIPIEIQSVDVGIEDEVTHDIPVTISVNTKLSLEVNKRTWLYDNLFIKIGTEERKFDETPSYKTESTIVDIERPISRHAVVRRAKSGELTELELVDMRPDFRKYIEEIDTNRTSQGSNL